MTTNLTDIWANTQANLKNQMTKATYETLILPSSLARTNGHFTVIAPNPDAKVWLENRLHQMVARSLSGVIGYTVEVDFALKSSLPQVITPEIEPAAPVSPPARLADGPAHQAAQADYIAAFFKRGGAGYSQVAHHTVYFWAMYLGPAYHLWQFLTAEDSRSLEQIAPNYWTPPKKYSFAELAQKLNRVHPRFIAGAPVECEKSRLARLAGQPLAKCCYGTSYDRLLHKTDETGLTCFHWSYGLLERLHQSQLVNIRLNQGERKPTIQCWRMLPLLTPYQYSFLNETLQADYDHWLDRFAHLFGLDRLTWETITTNFLPGLMPSFAEAAQTDNFNHRPLWQQFLGQSMVNPNFVTCMSRNQDAEADDDEFRDMHVTKSPEAD